MKYILIIISLIIFSCSYQKNKILSKGITQKERKIFVSENGGAIPWKIKDHFIMGLPYKGMYVDMVFKMYGEPDSKYVLKIDSVTQDIIEYKWTYYDYVQEKTLIMNLEILVELIFDETHTVTKIIGNTCKIIDNCSNDINSKYEK